MQLPKLPMWESQSPWRCLCANNFVCHVILLAPTRERTWSRKIRNPGMQYLAIAKTADTSTCLDGKLTQQRRPTRREDRKQYTWHDDTRISGCIQWQMQRCAVEEAETNVNQRNATSFKHDVLHSACQPSVFRQGILKSQHRWAGRLVDQCNEDLSHGTMFLQWCFSILLQDTAVNLH